MASRWRTLRILWREACQRVMIVSNPEGQKWTVLGMGPNNTFVGWRHGEKCVRQDLSPDDGAWEMVTLLKED